MGKPNQTSQDTANVVSAATFTAAGQATNWRAFSGRFNLHLQGAFVASVVLERSMDGGLTAVTCTDPVSPVVFTGPASTVLEAPETDVLYRLRCIAWTSGAINARLSQ